MNDLSYETAPTEKRSVADILQHMREAAIANSTDPRATTDEKRCWCDHLEMVVELEAALHPDRLAPIEARGVHREPHANGYDIDCPTCHYLFRARESAPAVEGADVCTCPDHGSWIHADDVKRLVRELDVAINGESGAAKQASLCDIVAQVTQHGLVAAESVATGCAGEVTDAMVHAVVDAIWDADIDQEDACRLVREALKAALSQPTRAAGES